MRTWLSAAAVAGLCLTLAGCGQTLTDPRVLVGEKTDISLLAFARGKVHLVGGCLGMNNEVVIWPYGTRVVDRDPLTITVPGTGRLRVGQNVELGGGMVVEHSDHEEARNRLRKAFPSAPKSCAKYDVFAAN